MNRQDIKILEGLLNEALKPYYLDWCWHREGPVYIKFEGNQILLEPLIDDDEIFTEIQKYPQPKLWNFVGSMIVAISEKYGTRKAADLLGIDNKTVTNWKKKINGDTIQ